MKILVTGHLGYIGSVLVPLLQQRGHDLHGLDSDLFGACDFSGAPVELPLVGHDLRDFVARGDAVEALRGFDAVIHLAGLSNDPLGDYRPGLTEAINCTASVDLARLAKQAGVSRFLFASSCSNYGASGNDYITEDAAFNPVTPYGESKAKVERLVGPMADENFSPTFLRASTAYGLSPRIRFDLVVNNLTAWAFTTGEVHLKSDGTAWRPIVHVEDIAAAYVAIVEAPREAVHGAAFNIGMTDENYRIRDIAEIVHRMVPGSTLGFAAGAEADKRNYRVDCDLIRRVLPSYRPRWTCRLGVEQLLEAYAAFGLKLAEFEGERYNRIAHMKHRLANGTVDADFRPVTQKAAA
ncbi:MAG: NAD-dependent dehydratase [Croceicoccus sp.]|nr:NAD-dependent dehydratase [Croceicoccus sp.]MAL24340.1 NAD-dependent dehydratase [Croceicoccus sp.]|tara:strand:+ start:54132 stop:55187 length:1056 start_codon:yes stop_codon:yes gene_type:complete